MLRERIRELKAFDAALSEVITEGFGPQTLRSQLRQYAVNDAMLCLKAQWLKRLSNVIEEGPLPAWKRLADETGLHVDFSIWIDEAMMHLDYHVLPWARSHRITITSLTIRRPQTWRRSSAPMR